MDYKTLDYIFRSRTLTGYIKSNLNDPWVGTNFADYVFLTPKHKGHFGEHFVSIFLKQLGFEVKPATGAHSSTAGYDRIVNDKKIEIKFSLATRSKTTTTGVKKDSFVINHISKDKDWDRLVFCGINKNPNDIRLFWFSKEDFITHLNSGEKSCFKKQQGGNKLKNDDYICTKINTLREYAWVHEDFSEF